MRTSKLLKTSYPLLVLCLLACGDDPEPQTSTTQVPVLPAATGGAMTTNDASTGDATSATGEPMPSDEVCDGLDNDLDAKVDEGLSGGECQTACGMGNEVCANGGWSCDAPAVFEEACNSIDDDCDGMIDEGVASVEMCNNVDDDCDGVVDEVAPVQCFVPGDGCTCGDPACDDKFVVAVRECVGGELSDDCTEIGPAAEICGDDIDNDGDCAIDEGSECDCDEGDRVSCSVDIGVCRRGERVCDENGETGACFLNGRQVRVPGGEETCYNNLDDDCDGSIDEECDCTPGSTRPCSVDQGVCTSGNRNCGDDNRWGDCVDGEGNVVLEPNNLPDDCSDPDADNDCDGNVDEDVQCMGEESQSCSSGEGLCAEGTQVCIPATCRFDTCIDAETMMPVLQPGALQETCSGLDEDCDGAVDENIDADPLGTNNSCASAKNLGSEENGFGAVTHTDVVVQGDNDYHYFTVEAVGGTFSPDRARVTVSIEGLQTGASYQVCYKPFYAGGVAFINADAAPNITQACSEFDSAKECQTLDGSVGSASLFEEERGGLGGAGRNDDILTVVEVTATFSDGGTCGGYTLRFSSN